MQRIAPLILTLIFAVLLFGAFGMQALAQDRLAAADAQAPQTVPPPPGFASVNVAHFAPFADDPADTSVTIAVNGVDVFTNVVYSNIVTGVNLPAGVYTVEVRPTGAVTVAISGVFTLPSGVEASILAIGDGSAGAPLKLEPILNDLTLPPVGKAKVLIGHYAPFNANPLLTAVDLCEDRVPTKVAGPIIFGINSGYLPLDAGIYDLSIAVANTNCAQTVYDLPPLQFNPGESYDAFAIGKNNAAYPIQAVSLSGLDYPATATIGHFAPFANTVAETAVDIRINGQLALTDVVYGAYAADIVMPSGALLVEILYPAGDVSGTVVLSNTFLFSQMGNYDLLAIGGANGWPLALATTPVSATAPAGQALLTLGHLAPFAPLAAQTAVDICLQDGTPLYTDVTYPTIVPDIVLSPDIYDLVIAKAGTSCQTVVLDPPAFRLGANDVKDAFVIGAPLDLFIPPTAASPMAGAEFPLQLTTTTGLRAPYELAFPLILSAAVEAE